MRTRSFVLFFICWLVIGQSTTFAQRGVIQAGADRMDVYLPKITGKKIGLVVNQTSITGGRHLVDTLRGLGVQLVKVFAPEHGFRGKADAGELISDSVDPDTGIPLVSIYGKKKKPSREDLADIDMVVFDIQDVGVRFYTYLSTLHYIMEACAEHQKPLIVMDRPNPNAHYVDGPVLKPGFTSFVGMHQVPVVYGMTIGEYASMINGEGWLKGGNRCNLEIIPCASYTHDSYYSIPVKPSPNLPNMRAVLLYPSICFFEGTHLSLGRGTDKQFQVIGHPKLTGPYTFTPMPNEGSKEPPLKGELCHGIDLSTLQEQDIFREKEINLSYLLEYYQKMKETGETYFLENRFIDKLAGTDELRLMILEGKNAAEIKASWQEDLRNFKDLRKKYLLYP
jgi:uncharacterized protein YbbC (DUF1343 family)